MCCGRVVVSWQCTEHCTWVDSGTAALRGFSWQKYLLQEQAALRVWHLPNAAGSRAAFAWLGGGCCTCAGVAQQWGCRGRVVSLVCRFQNILWSRRSHMPMPWRLACGAYGGPFVSAELKSCETVQLQPPRGMQGPVCLAYEPGTQSSDVLASVTCKEQFQKGLRLAAPP